MQLCAGSLVGYKDTGSDQHFVADATGVFKMRSIKRHPPSCQGDLALLQSISAHPWDPTGSRAETETFIFPAKRSEEATVPDPSTFAEEPQQWTVAGDVQEVEEVVGDE